MGDRDREATSSVSPGPQSCKVSKTFQVLIILSPAAAAWWEVRWKEVRISHRGLAHTRSCGGALCKPQKHGDNSANGT